MIVQLAGDVDRERAAASLRDHFVRGRLTLEELSERTELVLKARYRRELRRCLRGLPVWSPRVAAESVVRVVTLFVFTTAWFMFSFALLGVLGLTLIFHGATGLTLLAFLLVWLVPTYLLTRLWRGPRRRS